jgi:hypothetical protein
VGPGDGHRAPASRHGVAGAARGRQGAQAGRADRGHAPAGHSAKAKGQVAQGRAPAGLIEPNRRRQIGRELLEARLDLHGLDYDGPAPC